MSKQKYTTRRTTRCLALCGTFFLLLTFSAQARLKKPGPAPFDILHYKIDIRFNEKDLSFQAKTAITLRSEVENLTKVLLHYKEGTKTFALPLPLKKGEGVTITTVSEGKADEREQDGLFAVRPKPDGFPQFFTQFESTGARKVFPCFDEPFDKATTEVILTANARYTLLSNGQKVSEESLPGGLKQVHFVNNDPISTYHITFVAAELSPLRDTYASISSKKVPLSIYTRPGQTQDAAYAMQILKKALAFYEDYFGIPYPWESYGIVAVPGFVWGGMENKGLANLNEARLLWNETHPYAKKIWIAGLVAHELAHEWFGNRVTMVWWDDLWLNEAFATFAADKFEESLWGKDATTLFNFQWLERSYFPQDRGALSHPIIPKQVDTLDELFDSITYAKGVQVVKMLEKFVGKKKFRTGLQNYFAKHKLSNATTDQFLAEIEGASGLDLENFASAWLHQEGYPHLSLRWVPKGLQITQEGGPFVFKLNVGNKNLTLSKKKEVFAFAQEFFGKPLPINRGGGALVRYDWEEIDWPLALEDKNSFVRFETTHAAIAKQTASKSVLINRLQDPSKVVALGVSWSLIDNNLDSAFAQKAAEEVWKEALEVYLRLNKRDPIEAELATQLLTLLGQADFPDLYHLLRAKATSSQMDEQLGALAGLLRSSAPDRYDIFEKVLRNNRDRPQAKLELLRTLAMTPKEEVLGKINQYLSDTSLVAKDDATIPTRVWRTIYSENKKVVYSQVGIEEVSRFVKANLDRPGVASQALETLEEVAQAPKEIKQRVEKTMEDLLKTSPPEVIVSVGKKILTAARK